MENNSLVENNKVQKICVTCTNIIIENMSVFAKKIKDKTFWKVFGYCKKYLDILTKFIQNHNIIYQQIKKDYKISITIITGKQGKIVVNYIKRYNISEKDIKTI